ncbi:LSDR protein [Trichosporon asahii var. asahii CBS 2479]|uniref:LSDR protein n=1 Tax=Trichosporon asahii var. asahii (strain ATCC 90039 / CBS 2479 / JCM 2466 / KCTC 7840 / NBRC 103889/ NCYC 2677 / UAMH 7654) TaxID=1186058 RepID=J4UJF4_TRIAS|nr:LSDR protein [Trichosporon asahii var. asahii CBS 2479]EJT51915.1 LSDR protein [Trichosporon asahii var. asahii CBS 2479]
MALALSRAGADLILVQRNNTNTTTLDKIKSEGGVDGKGGKAEIAVCDLADAEAVKKLVPGIVSSGRIIDILVNCGGIQRRHPAEDFPEDDYAEVMQVNLNAVFTITRDVGKHMLETRKDGKRGNGKIISIASVISFQGGLNVPAYAAAKHGVLGLNKAFSNNWAGKGINVNAIAPGYIDTDMNEQLIADQTRSRQILERIPANRWGKPKDFDGVIVFLSSPASDWICGECVVVDGGWMSR